MKNLTIVGTKPIAFVHIEIEFGPSFAEAKLRMCIGIINKNLQL